jgi:glutamate dehydrogenase (NAD(P)+)
LKARGNLFKVATEQVTRAAEAIHLDPQILDILAQPKNELIINFPVRLDDGKYHMFKG